MEPIIVKNFFSADLMELLRFRTNEIKNNPKTSEDRKVFFRKQAYNPDPFKTLHILMQERVAHYFPEAVKPSYVFLSMYDDEKSICPVHTDREQCKYTIDVCIDQKEPWPLIIDGKSYLLMPGDAVIYSGTDHPHYRDRIAAGNFCDLVFFHFVPVAFEGWTM